MTPPSITVAIPFRDEERLLGDAVRSILGQTLEDFELLLVDDGSTDHSVEVARAFSDPRVTVLSDGARRGLPARLNEVVRRARGELVARMDADDVSHPTRLARQMEVLRDDPACDVVGTWAGLVDDDDVPFGVVEASPLPATAEIALTRGIVAHATILARKRWLQANPYDEALTRAEDRDLWCRTAETTRFAVLPEVLYVVRLSARDPRFLADYLAAQRQNRALFARRGPAIAGRRRTAELILASHAKAAVMRVAARAGLAERIVRRRGRPPTDEELARIGEALAAGRQRP